MIAAHGTNSVNFAMSLSHLQNAETIAEVFGVSRRTVVQWIADGAPIVMVGKKNQANYRELWEWIKEQGEKKGPQ